MKEKKIKKTLDWLKWVAAGFALVATASAEYELARAIGMDTWIAAAVPGALDAYVVRALRSHREVLTAVLAMVGVNAASHLVTAGVLHVGWPLITAVSAIAPLVLWRVHALSTPGERRRELIWDMPGETSAEGNTVPGGEWDQDWLSTWTEHGVLDEHGSVLPLRDRERTADTPVPDEHGSVLPLRDQERPVDTPVPDEHTRKLALVLTLPGGFEDEHMDEARLLDVEERKNSGNAVSVRTLKEVLRVGTARAQSIRKALDAEHARGTRA